MPTYDQPTLGWTVVLRRQPVRIVKGQPEGGYTDAYELICSECGDHPDQDRAMAHRQRRKYIRPRPRTVLDDVPTSTDL